jgi:putative ABC transport system substrate-binding protein
MLMLCDSKVMAIVVALATVASYGTLAQGQESSKIPRIGYVRSFGSGVGRQYTAFQQGLRDLGYIEGKNILTEFRSPQGNLRGEISELVRQLVQLKVDLIVAVDPTAIRAATQSL